MRTFSDNIGVLYMFNSGGTLYGVHCISCNMSVYSNRALMTNKVGLLDAA